MALTGNLRYRRPSCLTPPNRVPAAIHRCIAVVSLVTTVAFGGATAPPASAEVPGPETSGPAIGRFDFYLDIVWVPPDGSVQWVIWSRDPKQGTLNGWGDPGKGYARKIAPAGSASAMADISATSRRIDRMNVYWVEPDEQIGSAYWARETPGSVAERWKIETIKLDEDQQVVRPASPTGGVSAASPYADHLETFWIGPDGSVNRRWYDNFGSWRPPAGVADAGSADPGSRLAVVVPQGDRDHVDVFWIGSDGSVRALRCDVTKDCHDAQDIAAAGSADPRSGISALSRATERLDVFWIAANGEVRTRSWDGERWELSGPSTIAGAGAASPESGIAAVAPTPHEMVVGWANSVGAITVSTFADAWAPAKTVTKPGVALSNTTMAAASPTSRTVHFFWVQPEGQLGSIIRDANDAWQLPESIDPQP